MQTVTHESNYMYIRRFIYSKAIEVKDVQRYIFMFIQKNNTEL